MFCLTSQLEIESLQNVIQSLSVIQFQHSWLGVERFSGWQPMTSRPAHRNRLGICREC